LVATVSVFCWPWAFRYRRTHDHLKLRGSILPVVSMRRWATFGQGAADLNVAFIGDLCATAVGSEVEPAIPFHEPT